MGLVKCKHCSHQISKKATSCPGCGGPVKKEGIGIGGAFLLAVVGYVAYSMSGGFGDYAENLQASQASSVAARKEPPKKPTWQKHEFKDEMTGDVTKLTFLESSNSVKFDFPYNTPNGSKLRMVVRRMNGKLDAYLSIDKGQMICSSSSCSFRLKSGDDAAETWEASRSTTYDSDLMFVNNDPRFIYALEKQKPLKIGVKFHKAGERVFEFDPSGYVNP